MNEHFTVWTLFLFVVDVGAEITICIEMKSTGGGEGPCQHNLGAGKTIITAAWSVYINPADAKHFPMLRDLLLL